MDTAVSAPRRSIIGFPARLVVDRRQGFHPRATSERLQPGMPLRSLRAYDAPGGYPASDFQSTSYPPLGRNPVEGQPARALATSRSLRTPNQRRSCRYTSRRWKLWLTNTTCSRHLLFVQVVTLRGGRRDLDAGGFVRGSIRTGGSGRRRRCATWPPDELDLARVVLDVTEEGIQFPEPWSSVVAYCRPFSMGSTGAPGRLFDRLLK